MVSLFKSLKKNADTLNTVFHCCTVENYRLPEGKQELCRLQPKFIGLTSHMFQPLLSLSLTTCCTPQSDVIIGLGCHDTRVAERSVELFLEGFAPWLLFTGYLGNQTAGEIQPLQ